MKNIAVGLVPIALLLLSSCASVSVKGEHREASKPVQKPAKIYVAAFDTTKGAYKIAGTEAKDPESFKHKTAETLANYVTKCVNEHVVPAERAADAHRLPRQGWLITGEFLRVNTGNRELRALVGLGAGGSKMETRVSVIDLAGNGKPFLTFETTGGSNAMPGLLESSGPGSAAMSMTTQSMMGVTDDAARTSRMIAGELNTYMMERGWIAKGKKYSVKKLGEYQLIHEQYFH
ncbi:hypothetical protein CfE428DRAFT_4036 [Chthoniobacter flavus Ellin428]|uniref:Lipoprotein n=1 Tax=Chthoniobacter flavus Ellin428 TaxID=497964 RepID=B4D547_9BACT|nr:DUF4410 domain-containing protein [Chthoniobacter flavus]EDY18252.1 hypothetical protein CfE428DRAFT_4036 [Chthoniobacter flavus Ellin428]TCO91282.1 uncharacterized protein DUF4410 [Chthoniobacter flavus]